MNYMRKYIFVFGLFFLFLFRISFNYNSLPVSNETNYPYIKTDKISIIKGTEDIKQFIEVISVHDYDVEVDMSGVDIHKKGVYKANVIAKNKVSSSSKIIDVEVLDKIVYLTFDDGPSYNTQFILDILKIYNVKATFFVTGENYQYKQLIQDAYKQGHTIGLHAYSHDYETLYTSENGYFDDLNKIRQYVKSVTGYDSKFIRFPGGSSNTISKKYCHGIMKRLTKSVQNRGYEYFDWNISSGDAEASTVSASSIIEKATTIPSYSQDYIILLFHDSSNKTTTVDALPSIIEYYLDKGYTFMPIDKTSYIYHQPVLN